MNKYFLAEKYWTHLHEGNEYSSSYLVLEIESQDKDILKKDIHSHILSVFNSFDQNIRDKKGELKISNILSLVRDFTICVYNPDRIKIRFVDNESEDFAVDEYSLEYENHKRWLER